jgi:nitrite reductase (NO-forming)
MANSKIFLSVILLLAVALGLIVTVSTGLTLAQDSTDHSTGHHAANTVTVEYTLVTGGGTGQLVFLGKGGTIDGQINPTLTANPGDVVQITLINDDGMLHDLRIDGLDVGTEQFATLDDQQSFTFSADIPGEYAYFCSVPGHRQAGMEGSLIIGSASATASEGADIVHDPSDLPAAVGDRAPETVQIDLTAQEVIGQVADGTTMTYFTFNGTVPGPMFRVRVGDTVEVHFHNDTTSKFPHSVDFHAVTGPGGGAVFTNIVPGAEASFTFQALNPGLYVYHCATPSVAHHITNGMYGMILVEPEGGLPDVDREFYVMQGELYTEEPMGTQGYVHFSHEKLLAEDPEYFVFNGAAGGLTSDAHAMHATLGDTVRIYFGVGGPNFVSSFHVIGEIFDRVYDEGSLTNPPLTNVQTTLVPPGGATMVEFQTQVPGRFILVDHALARLEQGLAAYLYVDGEAQPDIFDGVMTAGSGH